MNPVTTNLTSGLSRLTRRIAAPLVVATLVASLLSGCERPPIQTSQIGFRGTGMENVQNPRALEVKYAENVVPEALPAVPDGGPLAGTIYQNVKVLGNVSVGNFTRTMLAITSWVSPTEGCAYCHVAGNFAADDKYTKVVARRMLQMTQHVNADWKPHVAATGVTCYTCHRGQPVPAKIWFEHPDATADRFAGNRAHQNEPAQSVAYASLPNDSFSNFLDGAENIRVNGTTALPTGNRSSIKQAEWTYGLMMSFSQSLGVNCTYCHNSRQFASWPESPPTRGTAWHGIRMVRDLNNAYLTPLTDTLPPERHGPAGDGPKVYCATCHQGAAKPLYGVSMLVDYPVFAGPTELPATTPAPAADAPAAAPEPAPEAKPAT